MSGLTLHSSQQNLNFQSDIENYVTRGHIDFPLKLPKDGNNQTFPDGMLRFRNINVEQYARDWLVWSQHIESLHCFLCRLFCNSVCCRLNTTSKSALATGNGWPASANWRKLCNRESEPEKGDGHIIIIIIIIIIMVIFKCYFSGELIALS